MKSTRPSAAEVILPLSPQTTEDPSSDAPPTPDKIPEVPKETPGEIPEKIELEMTPRFYKLMKQKMLAKHNALIRSHVETYLEWLRTLNPEDIVDAIETNTSLKDAYSKAPFKWRLAIAGARAFLKSSKRYAAQFRKVVDLELALITLKFENPAANTVIQQYGERGMNYLKQSLQDALVIFGVEKEAPKPA